VPRLYNEERPHSSLGYKTPKQFAEAPAASFYIAERGAKDQTVTKLANDSKERAMFRVLEHHFFIFDDEMALGETRRRKAVQAAASAAANWARPRTFTESRAYRRR